MPRRSSSYSEDRIETAKKLKELDIVNGRDRAAVIIR